MARRLASRDHAARPRLLTAGLGLVTAGLLAEAAIASLGRLGPWQPVLVLLAAAVLGGGYGFCLVFGLAEVARLARPDDLAGLAAVFQVASYIGFAVPFLLSCCGGRVRPGAAARPGRAGRDHAGRHRVAGPPHGRAPGQPFMLNVNILSATMRAPIASISFSQLSNSGPCSGR